MSSQGELGNLGEPPVSLSHTRNGGPGDQRPWRALGASPWSRAREGHYELWKQARYREGERQAKPPRGTVGSRSVVEYRRRWGSEAQATHGREGDVGQSVQWADTRERLCAHQACHQTPIGLHPGAAEALLEEPYAFIAHVRVCGGGAPFNGIRDRSRRELRVDSGVRGTQHASRRGTPWGVKPVDNGPTSASHTADERATPAI